MRTVRPPPLLGSLVDLNVLDNQIAGVQALGIRVRLGVLQQREEELGRLDGPAGLGDAKLLAFTAVLSVYFVPYASTHMAAFSMT